MIGHQAVPDPEIAAFRHFNRFYTRLLGLFGNSYVSSKMSLTEGRVLFEIAVNGNRSATAIAGELNLDPGYLSRILRKFQEKGIVARSTSRTDARNAILRLTTRGKNVFADLDHRSAQQARGVLEPLTPATRDALLRSMHIVEEALAPKAQTRAPFILRTHRPGDIGWIVSRNGAVYAQEYGWDDTFEALVARICADFIDRFDSRRERCWIAERDGEPLGCIFLVRHPEKEDTAKLRMLFVEPAARGLGLGKALVTECVNFARSAGYKRITLWTQSILAAAHRIYAQAGFQLVAEQPHHSFGKDLIGQTWDLDL